jgi:hypothetical protein
MVNPFEKSFFSQANWLYNRAITLDMPEDYDVPRHEHKDITDYEAIYLFPEAKKDIRKIISELNEEIIRIEKEEKKIMQMAQRLSPSYTHTEELYLMLLLMIGETEKKELYKNRINILKRITTKPKQFDRRVLEIPITDYLEVNRYNKTICPWHTDTHPSLHYYKKNNSVYCFVCNKYGNVVHVVQAIKGFKNYQEAYNYLAK